MKHCHKCGGPYERGHRAVCPEQPEPLDPIDHLMVVENHYFIQCLRDFLGLRPIKGLHLE